MSGYKSIAIVGTTGLSTFIQSALEQTSAKVIVLTRKSPEKPNQVQVDYNDSAAVVRALQGVDVVIATIGQDALADQKTLADNAKAAGVKLFLPSEFGGSDTLPGGPTHPLMQQKRDVAAHLEKIGLPYLRIANYFFADWINIFQPVNDGKITIVGDGKSKIGFTSREDIGRFVAYVLTQRPPADLENKYLHISGDRKSWLEVVALREKKDGRKYEVTHVPVDEEKVKEGDFFAYLAKAVQDGKVSVPDEKLANGLYPDWNPHALEYYL